MGVPELTGLDRPSFGSWSGAMTDRYRCRIAGEFHREQNLGQKGWRYMSVYHNMTRLWG